MPQAINQLSVDSLSRIEIGGAGTGAFGKITVDAGATLTALGFLNGDLVNDGTFDLAAVQRQLLRPQ